MEIISLVVQLRWICARPEVQSGPVVQHYHWKASARRISQRVAVDGAHQFPEDEAIRRDRPDSTQTTEGTRTQP